MGLNPGPPGQVGVTGGLVMDEFFGVVVSNFDWWVGGWDEDGRGAWRKGLRVAGRVTNGLMASLTLVARMPMAMWLASEIYTCLLSII